MNIAPTILRKKIEDVRQLGAFIAPWTFWFISREFQDRLARDPAKVWLEDVLCERNAE